MAETKFERILYYTYGTITAIYTSMATKGTDTTTEDVGGVGVGMKVNKYCK